MGSCASTGACKSVKVPKQKPVTQVSKELETVASKPKVQPGRKNSLDGHQVKKHSQEAGSQDLSNKSEKSEKSTKHATQIIKWKLRNSFDEEINELEKKVDSEPKKVVKPSSLAYQKGQKLGTGAFGEVYQCLNLKTGELMAVKAIKFPGPPSKIQNYCKMLQRELAILNQIPIRTIVKTWYVDVSNEEESIVDIVFEYGSGGSISSLLSRFKKLDERISAIYVKQILETLCILHECDIIHRDIKSSNVLMDAIGTIKLSDFGCCKWFDPPEEIPSDLLIDIMEDVVVPIEGSIFWQAPEVLSKTSQNKPSDIWSVGCLLIEMLTGVPPWSHLSQDPSEVKNLILSKDAPPFPKGISEDCRDFLKQIFQKDPTKRPTIDQLLEHKFIKDNSCCGDAALTGGTESQLCDTHSVVAFNRGDSSFMNSVQGKTKLFESVSHFGAPTMSRQGSKFQLGQALEKKDNPSYFRRKSLFENAPLSLTATNWDQRSIAGNPSTYTSRGETPTYKNNSRVAYLGNFDLEGIGGKNQKAGNEGRKYSNLRPMNNNSGAMLSSPKYEHHHHDHLHHHHEHIHLNLDSSKQVEQESKMRAMKGKRFTIQEEDMLNEEGEDSPLNARMSLSETRKSRFSQKGSCPIIGSKSEVFSNVKVESKLDDETPHFPQKSLKERNEKKLTSFENEAINELAGNTAKSEYVDDAANPSPANIEKLSPRKRLTTEERKLELKKLEEQMLMDLGTSRTSMDKNLSSNNLAEVSNGQLSEDRLVSQFEDEDIYIITDYAKKISAEETLTKPSTENLTAEERMLLRKKLEEQMMLDVEDDAMSNASAHNVDEPPLKNLTEEERIRERNRLEEQMAMDLELEKRRSSEQSTGEPGELKSPLIGSEELSGHLTFGKAPTQAQRRKYRFTFGNLDDVMSHHQSTLTPGFR